MTRAVESWNGADGRISIDEFAAIEERAWREGERYRLRAQRSYLRRKRARHALRRIVARVARRLWVANLVFVVVATMYLAWEFGAMWLDWAGWR